HLGATERVPAKRPIRPYPAPPHEWGGWEGGADPIATAQRDKPHLYDEIKDLVEANQEILIFGHKDADGDTLGCSLAFAEALRARGKVVYVVIPPPLPDKYSWMPGFDQIVEGPPPDAEVHLVLFFDAGNMARSGSAVDQIHDHATVVNVDHHTSNSRFGDINIIDPDAAAVGQMCLDLFNHFGWEITPTMATNLYTALM